MIRARNTDKGTAARSIARASPSPTTTSYRGQLPLDMATSKGADRLYP